MTIGMLTLIINVGAWWFLLSRAPRVGAKIFFCILALLNTWILLDRTLLHLGTEHHSLSRTVSGITDHKH